MSLPDDAVYPILKNDFVLGWKNIRREDYVGASFGYTKRHSCVGTTNGAGSHNVQIFVLSPDLVVMHALPGFWHPEDLARELRFAKVLLRLWQDDTRTDAEKRAMYSRLQLTELRYQSPEMYARSDWQEFDKTREGAALAGKDRDTFRHTKDGEVKRTARGAPILKSLNVLTHERMAQRPFLKFEEFDFARFIDYGRKFYDNNLGVSGRGKKLR